MPKFILTRHGESIWNGSGISQGSDPNPHNTLTSKGREQSRAKGRLFVREGIIPAAAWSSPLPRALETGRIALNVMGCRLTLREEARFREMSKGKGSLPGGLEGKKSAKVKTPEYREQYKRQGLDFRHGSEESGGETGRETGVRFFAAMNAIADQLADDDIGLVFAHGQSIRFGVGSGMLRIPSKEQIDSRFTLANCESLIVARERNQWHFLGRMAAA